MKATDVIPSRFERAKDEGSDLAACASATKMVIVAAASQRAWLCG